MIKLQPLIRYWKERRQPHPPMPLLSWNDALTYTIYYLEELNRIKEVSSGDIKPNLEAGATGKQGLVKERRCP